MKLFYLTDSKKKSTKDYHIVALNFTLFFLLISALLFTMGEKVSAETFTSLTSQMDIGAKGMNVTNLQTFMATNPTIYPEGLITGYYGNLTSNAVKKFQALYNLDQVGRVGPKTLDKINNLITGGGWVALDNSGPSFYNTMMSNGVNQATFQFSTDENTNARVVYYTNPLMFNEGDITSNGFGPIGGYIANSNNSFGTNHSITLPNLTSNTLYYYTIIATDASGNISVIGPNSSFRTSL